MIESYVRNVIEAALLAAGRPLKSEELGQLFDEAARPSEAALREVIEALALEYAGRGIELKETASGLRIQVRKEFAAEVSRLWPERPARYSRALLETLALIAYRQPITRGEIEDVRGVAVNPNIIKTLLERNWVRVVGQRDVPGRPELLGTTREFLDYFGLVSLDQLPPLSELKAVGDLNLQLDLGSDAGAPGEGNAPRAQGEPVTQEDELCGEETPDEQTERQVESAETASGAAPAAEPEDPGASADADRGESAGALEAADEGSPEDPDERAGTGDEGDAQDAPPREMRAAPGDSA